ncbi:phage holin family protein [Rossellomorea sp. BNER]|uniref:phage holin family protein n=1 Tax=Rossellomorea sp. BNER TaxID=2962031 RepID=UPI003AF255B6|nr:phage holin family protein [Rossellomorea sp. BNER]
MTKFIIPFGSIVASITSSLFGGITSLLSILVIAVIVDYFTGLIASGIQGNLSSKVGLKGIGRKVLIFSLVAVAHLIDTILGNQHFIRDATIIFYIANEFLSIIENAGRAGVPIPDFIRQAIKSLKNHLPRGK